MLLSKYREFEKSYCGDLLDEVVALQKTKAIQLMKDKGTELKEVDFMTPEFLDLVMKQNELLELQTECKEMFLIDNEFANAKILCEIWYEDYVFNQNDFEDYGKCYEFLMETIDGFFLTQRNMSSSVQSMKKNSTTE